MVLCKCNTLMGHLTTQETAQKTLEDERMFMKLHPIFQYEQKDLPSTMIKYRQQQKEGNLRLKENED